MNGFINFAKSHGLEIDSSKFYPSSKIHRCGTIEKPRSLNGSYLWDGQRGWIFNWSGDARVNWYNDPNAKPWTDEEKRAFELKRQTQRSDQDRAYEQAALKADVTLRSATLEKHGYLSFKGFEDEKGLVLDGKLLIPMRNVVTNKLQGYQQIYFDYDEHKYNKKMLTGMRAKNAVFRFGERTSEETWLVEGYATGLSVRNALKSCGISASVVICFSASNLVQVADQMPNKRYIFADNDESATGEKSAIATGLPYTMANEVGMDANDLHMKEGLFAVVRKIMQLRQEVLTSIDM